MSRFKTETQKLIYFNGSDYLENHFLTYFFERFFETSKNFHSQVFGGLVDDPDAFFAELQNLPGVEKCFETIDEGDSSRYFVMEDALAYVYSSKNSKLSATVVTDNMDRLNVLKKFFEEKFKEVKREKQLHMIAPDEFGEGNTLYPLGEVAVPLERGNYEESNTRDFDTIIKELNSENPSGRFVIIDGPPGTGKSYYVRGILNEINYGVCVLVPVSMLEALDKPSLMPILLNERKIKKAQTDKKPVLLIIEDADTLLVPRESDNISAISSLLNYTDGLFGSIFDLRIIATTNSKHADIEPALLRPGRLLKRVHVGELSLKKAWEVYLRLTNGNPTQEFKKGMTLANVYAISKGLEPDEEEHEAKLGF